MAAILLTPVLFFGSVNMNPVTASMLAIFIAALEEQEVTSASGRLCSAVTGYLHQIEGASPILKDGSLDSLVGIGSQPRIQELLCGQVVKQALHMRRIGSDGGEGLLGNPGLALFSRMPFSTSGSQNSVSSSMVLFLCRHGE